MIAVSLIRPFAVSLLLALVGCSTARRVNRFLDAATVAAYQSTNVIARVTEYVTDANVRSAERHVQIVRILIGLALALGWFTRRNAVDFTAELWRRFRNRQTLKRRIKEAQDPACGRNERNNT